MGRRISRSEGPFSCIVWKFFVCQLGLLFIGNVLARSFPVGCKVDWKSVMSIVVCFPEKIAFVSSTIIQLFKSTKFSKELREHYWLDSDPPLLMQPSVIAIFLEAVFSFFIIYPECIISVMDIYFSYNFSVQKWPKQFWSVKCSLPTPLVLAALRSSSLTLFKLAKRQLITVNLIPHTHSSHKMIFTCLFQLVLIVFGLGFFCRFSCLELFLLELDKDNLFLKVRPWRCFFCGQNGGRDFSWHGKTSLIWTFVLSRNLVF